jgi:dihydropteroate synthase
VLPSRRSFTLRLPAGHVLQLGERTLVMGILNVTPDSFAEPGPRLDPAAAIDAALRMEAEGADLIDVGGESTRPGASAVPSDEELRRVLPVLRALAGRLAIPISVDTSKAAVARAALTEGATVINDVTGLQADPEIGRVAAEAGAGLVLMHMRGRPRTMYADAHYEDLVAEVVRELEASVHVAVECGVNRDQLVLDPGIGFAKHAEHSYGVLARFAQLAAALDFPFLVGPSRKSFMREALEGRPAVDRDWGTAAAVTAAILAGAHVVRVHAVAEMRQVARVADEIRRHADRSKETHANQR